MKCQEPSLKQKHIGTKMILLVMHLETLQIETIMFGEVGIAYVYFTYGMHYCFNVVAKKMKTPAGAVLIRGIVPEKGIKKMQENRNIENLKNLTNGPAKLTQALEITKEHYGIDLTKKTELYIEEGLEIKKIKKSTRIGIKDGKEMLWNFQI